MSQDKDKDTVKCKDKKETVLTLAHDRWTFDFHMNGKTQNAPASGPPVVTTSSPSSGSPPWKKMCSQKTTLFHYFSTWHIPSLLQNCLTEHSSRHNVVAFEIKLNLIQILINLESHLTSFSWAFGILPTERLSAYISTITVWKAECWKCKKVGRWGCDGGKFVP